MAPALRLRFARIPRFPRLPRFCAFCARPCVLSAPEQAVTIGRVGRFSTRKLSTQIFTAQLAILTATVLIGFVLFARTERSQLDRQYEQRAGAIAQTVAGVPDIQACLQGIRDTCREPIQAIASRIQRETERVLRRGHRHEPGAALAPGCRH